MAEPRIYIASTSAIVAYNTARQAVPLGLVANLTFTLNHEIEGVREWGNFAVAEYLRHGYAGTFAWGRAWSEGFDLIGQGLFPSIAAIAQFGLIDLTIIDSLGQRNIAQIRHAVIGTFSMGADARQKLMQNVTGECQSILLESEI
jgi:hypothetical protein